jgi:vesicle-fusing ATPase
MRKNEKLFGDVDLAELATMTKNFSGAEIEGLVRAAQSCALNRLVKASSKVIFILLSWFSLIMKIRFRK